MIKITQIRHVGIVVVDLERALWFYRDLLGLVVQRRMKESGACIDNVLALENVTLETVKLGLEGEVTQVELLSFSSHEVQTHTSQRTLLAGPTHVAFSVDDLQSLYEDMKKEGVEFHCSPQLSPDGKVLLTYCKDPNGGLVELVEVL